MLCLKLTKYFNKIFVFEDLFCRNGGAILIAKVVVYPEIWKFEAVIAAKMGFLFES